MPRRPFGWIAVLGIGLSGVAVTWPQSPRSEPARREAWKLAQESIQDGGIRKGVPAFITWASTREIFPCGDRSPAVLRRVSARDLLDESFHYNPQAAARLCEPLSPKGAVPLDVAQAEWAKAE